MKFQELFNQLNELNTKGEATDQNIEVVDNSLKYFVQDLSFKSDELVLLTSRSFFKEFSASDLLNRMKDCKNLINDEADCKIVIDNKVTDSKDIAGFFVSKWKVEVFS